MMGEQRVDVVVVGGGAMGLSTAWWAAPEAEVVVLERFSLGHHRGASHGGERIFRYAYTDEAYVEMAIAADEGWQRLERDAGQHLLERAGCVDHGPHAQVSRLAAVAQRLDVAIEVLTARDAGRRWPALRFESDALLQPTAGWARAADAVVALARLAALRGARLHFDTPVSRIELVDSGIRVHAGGQAFDADVAVVTAGAWVAGLLPGVRLPKLTTTEEHVFYFRALPWAQRHLPAFLHWRDTEYYGLPAADGHVKIGEHQTGDVTTGDGRSFASDPVRTARIERYVRRWLPGIPPMAVRTATCLFTSTPSADFVLDRVGSVVVGAGFSGHAFKFVPEIGRRLAAMATTGEVPCAPFTLASHATYGSI